MLKSEVLASDESWLELFSDGNGMEKGNQNELDACSLQHRNAYSIGNWSGGNFYANCVYKHADIETMLCKLSQDFTAGTRYIVVLPYIPNASWQHHLSHYRVLAEYEVGSKRIFSCRREDTYNPEELEPCSPDEGGGDRVFIAGTLWPVRVYYRDEFTPVTVDTTVLTHCVTFYCPRPRTFSTLLHPGIVCKSIAMLLYESVCLKIPVSCFTAYFSLNSRRLLSTQNFRLLDNGMLYY